MIQPKPSTIGEILTLAEHFVVPKYQRGFAWNTDEAGEFLVDLEAESHGGRGLFLGTLIFNISEQSEDRILIVDGQQRLTTIFLLLIACRELAKKLALSGVAQETQKRITVTDPTTAESKGPLLVASEAIRDVFNEMTKSDGTAASHRRSDLSPSKGRAATYGLFTTTSKSKSRTTPKTN